MSLNLKSFFSNKLFSTQKTISPQVLEETNYSYFSSSVKDLLNLELVKLTQYKQHLYKKFLDVLTDQDKTEIISYYRCKNNAKFVSNYKNLEQDISIIDIKSGYSYTSTNDRRQWYINFADKHLFGFYNTNLFAQDEIQCAEHPLLPHVRVAAELLGKNVAPYTIENGPTPILIKNVQRLGEVKIQPTNENSFGLYGNNFAKASLVYIDKMCIPIRENKHFTNFIAMAALGHGIGAYKFDEIKFLFETAKNSFSLAEELSQGEQVELHTGNWGCGAFGNNRQLIACIQLYAAHLSGIKNVVYHTFDIQGKKGFDQGKQLYEKFLQDQRMNQCINDSNQIETQFLSFLFNQNFQWGYSDGN